VISRTIDCEFAHLSVLCCVHDCM